MARPTTPKAEILNLRITPALSARLDAAAAALEAQAAETGLGVRWETSR